MHRLDSRQSDKVIRIARRNGPSDRFQVRASWFVLACVFLLLQVAPMFGQDNVEKAKAILKAGITAKSVNERAVATRVLGLVENNPKAEELALKALEDETPEVRSAAAEALGQMKAEAAAPKLVAALREEEDVSVIIAGARSLIKLGDPLGYTVYYAVLTGEKKSGGNLLEEQKKMLRDPKKMAKFGFEQGIGFIPFAAVGYSAIKALTKDDASPVRAAAAKILANDPDPKSGAALVEAASDKSWIVRAAALEALSQRNDPSVLPQIEPKMDDKKDAVRLTAAAAVIHLQSLQSGKTRHKEK